MAKQFIRKAGKGFLIGLNILVACLFIFSSYSYLFNPVVFWYMGFLPLASLYFLLAIFIFIIFWFFIKPRYVIINILALLICFSPLQEIFAIHNTPKFSLQKKQGSIRVMSWNVEHFQILKHKDNSELKEDMLNLINEYAPDVACFQEMVGSDTAPDAINYIPDIAKKLGMPYVHYSYNPRLDFDNKHRFGIIIFSRLPMHEVHTMSYAPKDYNSIFQYADIVKEGDTFRLYNIHLQSLKFDKENLEYLQEPVVTEGKNFTKSMGLLPKFKNGFIKRKTQSDRIAASIAKSPYPVILCGDFNDVPNSYAYHRIGQNMKNAFTAKGHGIGRTFINISPTLRIDNIFYSGKLQVQQFIRVKKTLSDHFPIVADLKFKN